MARHQGFTLLELLVTLAIVAVLLALTTPGFIDSIQRQRLRTSTDSFMHAVQFTRMRALTAKRRVCLVRKESSWQAGWTIFEDLNANCEQDEDETRIAEHGALPDGIKAKGTTNAAGYISYLPDGQSVQLSGAFLATSIYFCPTRPTMEGYRIVISRGGRPRLEPVPAGADACAG